MKYPFPAFSIIPAGWLDNIATGRTDVAPLARTRTHTNGSVGRVETRHLDLTEAVRLDCGRVLHPIRIAYETYGVLSAQRDNVKGESPENRVGVGSAWAAPSIVTAAPAGLDTISTIVWVGRSPAPTPRGRCGCPSDRSRRT